MRGLRDIIRLTATHQPLAGQNLQQLDEHLAVPEISVEICDLAVDPDQVRVDPLREGLLLHMLSLVWGKGGFRVDNKQP
jgi:hypothetical protein